MCKTQLVVHSQLAPPLRNPIHIQVPVVASVAMLIFGKVGFIFARSDGMEAPGAD
jgi:hypothetical protein